MHSFHHLFGKLARIHLPLLSQTHERIALVIAVLWICTRTHQNAGTICIRQMRQRCFLKALLDLGLDHSDYSAGWLMIC